MQSWKLIIRFVGRRFPTSGNKAFIKDLTSWTFQESGVLRASGAVLSRAIDGKSLSLYRVRDELVRLRLFPA